VVHDTAQNSSDNLPSYPLDNHRNSNNNYLLGRNGFALQCKFMDYTTGFRMTESLNLRVAELKHFRFVDEMFVSKQQLS